MQTHRRAIAHRTGTFVGRAIGGANCVRARLLVFGSACPAACTTGDQLQNRFKTAGSAL